MKSLEHPYNDLTGGQWLRGNLHTHTTRSDGDRTRAGIAIHPGDDRRVQGRAG